MTDLQKQIEEAFSYRGHVTLTLTSGKEVVGFLFNREFDNPNLEKDQFVEVFLQGSGNREMFAVADLQSVSLTGKDCAAGKSYEEWLEKQAAKKAS